MTAFVNSIQEILKARHSGLHLIALEVTSSKTELAYQEVKIKLGEDGNHKPMPPEESEYWIELARNTALNKTWGDLKPKEIRNISKCLLYSSTSTPLVLDDKFLTPLIESCQKNLKKRLCAILIDGYLSNYKKDGQGIKLLGKWLAQTVTVWDWPWADRQKSFSLFDNDDAPRVISDIIMKSNDSLEKVLNDCGISGNRLSVGMGSYAFLETLKFFRKNAESLSTGNTLFYLKRIQEWSVADGKSFSYPTLKTTFIESLLLPWVNATPDEKIVNQTLGLLIDFFGDPRLGGASWILVNEDAMRIIRGWLVKRALAQFLDVVDELALDRQWKYRRAFWMAYYNKGVISDAWVAFAGNGASKAREIAKRHKDNSWLSFGNLYGSGDANHAVLILRIGDLIIADFSHMGKWRIWKAVSNQKAPKPYEKQYDRYDIMHGNADHEGPHLPVDGWQRKVEQVIANATGIKLMMKEYMPR